MHFQASTGCDGGFVEYSVVTATSNTSACGGVPNFDPATATLSYAVQWGQPYTDAAFTATLDR
mgnify:CR=1 FL=1